jgi:phosphoglycerate dehydrogenase-like enzyme
MKLAVVGAGAIGSTVAEFAESYSRENYCTESSGPTTSSSS